MARYNYLDDVLEELRKDRDARFDISMLNNLSLSIGEWLSMVSQLDKRKNDHYKAIIKEYDLSRINSKGDQLDVSSWGAKMVLAKRSRQGLRTLDDIVNHFKKGYELIHRIRELLTSQEITYSVLYATRQHKDGYKPLFEAHLTLDQVLAETRPAYKDIQTVNVDTEFSNVLSLEFANADARRAVDAAEKQGGSSISNALDKRDLWDTLVEYAEANHPNANRGRLYEVYSTLVKTPRYQKINYIGHHKGQANTEGLASALIKQALADRDFGWQKGDIALEQLKAVFNANAALIDGSTIKVVLTEIYQALRAQTEQELIDNLTKIFTVKKQQFDLEVDALVKEEAVIAIEKKIKEGKIFDIK